MGKRVVIPDDVLCQIIGETVVIFDVRSGEYLALDGVGARFWQLCQEDGDLNKAVAVLLQEYEVGEETLRTDVAELVDELVAVGVLTVTEA
ncbi:PqqD family protein [Tistrella mobilis]|uniref:PqqD family protein n=1 Tax=Tistrella mobilis TaxID=171437 RepID=UPI003555FB9D